MLSSHPVRALLIVASAMLALAPMSASAADIAWDGETDTTWSTATNWVGDIAPVAAGDNAVFSGTFTPQPNLTGSTATNFGGVWMTGTPGQSTTISASSASDVLNLNASTLNLISNLGILVDNTNAFTLTITSNVTVQSAQTWRNSSTNLFTASGEIAKAAGNTLTLSNTSTGGTTLSGVISGAGAVTVSNTGAGVTTFSHATVGAGGSSYGGQLTLERGILSVPVLHNVSQQGPLGNATGAQPVILGSSGQTGTLRFTNVAATAGSKTFSLATGGTGEFNITDAQVTASGAITGSGLLAKTGPGTLVLSSGSNSWSGGTTVSGGMLSITDAVNLGADNATNIVTISSGATLRRNGTTGSASAPNSFGARPIVIGTGGGIIEVTGSNEGSQIGDGLLGGAGNLTKNGAGVLVLGGDNPYTGSLITVNGGANAATGQTGLRLLSDNALGDEDTSTQVELNLATVSGSIGNQVALRGGITIPATKSLVMNNSSIPNDPDPGDRRVSLISDSSGSNTWNGPITINGPGKVQFLSSVASETFTVYGSVTGDGGGGSGNWLTLRGTSTGTGGVTGGVIGATSTINLGATGTLLKAEAGSWTVNSTGHTWGTTLMENGTLKLVAHNVLPTASTLQMGNASNSNAPILDLNGFNQTVGNLTFLAGTGTRTITSGDAATFTVNNATDGFYNSTNTVITGDVSLVKSGAGTLTLGASTSSNTYTGSTTVKNGTLVVVGTGHATGSGYVIEKGGTLGGTSTITTAGDITFSDSVGSGTNSTLSPGASIGTLTLNAANVELNPASKLVMELDGTKPGISFIGGSDNDLVVVGGVSSILILNGTLDVTPVGSFASVVAGDTWRLITYTGSLTNNGLILGSTPDISGLGLAFAIDTSTLGEVNLTINAIPEASAFLAVGLIAVGSGIASSFRRRRRMRTAPAQEA